MRAITVSPGIANSARLDEVPEPPLSDGAVLVRTRALGVCATDREILSGAYGTIPGRGASSSAMSRWARWKPRLPIARSRRATSWSASSADPTPSRARPAPSANGTCAATAANTERGIKERHGYGAERFRIEPEFVVKVDPALDILGVLPE